MEPATTATKALDGLREIPLPPAVSWMPQTIGWLVVALVFAAALGWLAWRGLPPLNPG